eukprot:515613-Lingulodinium_polyedra.AAC.1
MSTPFCGASSVGGNSGVPAPCCTLHSVHPPINRQRPCWQASPQPREQRTVRACMHGRRAGAPITSVRQIGATQ